MTMQDNRQLALLGGIPVRREPFPPYNTIGKAEKGNALKVLDSGLLSGFVATPGADFLGGKEVQGLESDFCNFFGTDYAISFNSASSALHACLAAARVGKGDEVIVSPYTMSASATAAIICGAIPVFVDIEPDTFCMDVDQVVKALTARTKAIMVVNIFGQPADLYPLRKLADQNDLILIEDNAQAPGSRYNGRYAGTVGHMGVFSLNRHKTIQCGEGGVAVTDNSELTYRLRLIRNHGEVVQAQLSHEEQNPAHFDIIGYNYRLTDLQAAVARPQLARLEQLNKHRVELADYLSLGLKDYTFLIPPKIREGCSHVYYLYPMIYRQEVLGISRDLFIKALIAEGMPVANYVEPLYRLPIYNNLLSGMADYSPERFPVVEDLWQSTMITTSLCRQPLTKDHTKEFLVAVDKVAHGAKKMIEHDKR